LKKVIILFGVLISLLRADNSYELGDGVQVASLPFYLGGYISTEYRHTKVQDRYKIGDIALLGYGSSNNFSYLTEIEYKNLYTEKQENDTSLVNNDTNLYIERLYVDYTFNENYMARVGKYISPIGFWNLLPINVLRDTTSDPISTNIIFPESTTGLYASYTKFSQTEFKVDVMLQNNEDIDGKYNNYRTNRHYGLGISYAKSQYTFKLNVGYFNKLHSYIDDDGTENEYEEESDYDDEYIEKSNTVQDLYYILLSAKYENEKYQFLSEIGHQESTNGLTTPYAAYVQGLYRMTPQHMAILRLESYEDKVKNKQDNFAIFGYTYRPLYPIAFKAEYQFHKRPIDNKLQLSFSVLF